MVGCRCEMRQRPYELHHQRVYQILVTDEYRSLVEWYLAGENRSAWRKNLPSWPLCSRTRLNRKDILCINFVFLYNICSKHFFFYFMSI